MVEALESISFFKDLMRFPPRESAVRDTITQMTDALTKVIEQGERENVFRKIAPRVVAEALLAHDRTRLPRYVACHLGRRGAADLPDLLVRPTDQPESGVGLRLP